MIVFNSFKLVQLESSASYDIVAYDNSLHNPVYGMGTLNGDERNGIPKVEEDPCPLYEDLDKLGKLPIYVGLNFNKLDCKD